MNFTTRVVHASARNIEDILTDKRVWVAVIGFVIALNQWLGWEVPQQVFIAAEALIVSMVVAWKGE